jgi:hypothetical protein
MDELRENPDPVIQSSQYGQTLYLLTPQGT